MSVLRPRVLVVGRGSPERGGIATFMHALVTGPLADDVDFDFLNLTGEADMGAGGALSAENIRRTFVDVRTVFVRAADADIVHIHSALAPASTLLRAGVLAAASRLRGARVVIHAHGGRFVSFAEQRSASLLIRMCLAPADRVIAVASAVHVSLGSTAARDRTRMIGNGVDCDRFEVGAVRRDGRPRILFVGHLTERKGVLDLVAASNELIDRGQDHELLLLGGRSDDGSSAYEKVLDILDHTADHVKLLGTVDPDEMPGIYRMADIYCLPSWWEAMPLSVLEAMAAGLPVVATDVGDVSQMLDPQYGMVVPARSVEALTKALESLVTDPVRRRSMGAAARHAAERRFALSDTLDQVLATYRELMVRS